MLVTTMKEIISKSKFGFDKTLRDNLYKTGKLMNEDYTFQQAEGDAAKYRTIYEDFNDFESLVQVAPAKETITEFCRLLKENYDFQLTDARLIRSLRAEDINQDLVDILNSINSE